MSVFDIVKSIFLKPINSPGSYTMYTVKKGDTLSQIAVDHGHGSDYMTIFNHNRHILHDPDKIYPGQVLYIPRKK